MLWRVQNLYIKVEAYTPEEFNWLTEYLSYKERTFKKAYGYKVNQIGLFNQLTDEFPTGLAKTTWLEAKKRGFKIKVADERVDPCESDPLADLAWLRRHPAVSGEITHQIESVEAAVAKKRGILWLPTGCLTSDTKIVINRGGRAFPMELKTVVQRLRGEATKNRAGRLCRWDLSKPTYTQSIVDGFVRKNRIVRAYDNGFQEVYELVTDTNKVIRSTISHRFMTEDGSWARLGDLNVGDGILVASWPTSMSRQLKPKCRYRQVSHMRNHPHAVITESKRDGKLWRVAEHRLVHEAVRLNDISLAEFVGRIVLNDIQGLRFLEPSVHVHHVDEDPTNNDITNLEAMPASEHLRLHGVSDGWKHVAGRTQVEHVRSITPIGVEPVYDLEMEAPHHNYVANQFVVHNSGKTEIAIGITKAVPCRWLFLVHRVDLLQQTAERYELRTGLRAGIVGDGKVDIPTDCKFVVCSFQTAHRGHDNAKPEIVHLLEEWTQGILVDECHALGANTFWSTLMRTFNATYRIGLSGTPLARTDNKNLLIIGGLGPVIYRVTPQKLISLGLLADPTIRMLDYQHNPKGTTWQGVYGKCIVRNRARNILVTDIARRAEKPCLLFVQQVKHGSEMVQRLNDANITARFAWGAKSTAKRKELVTQLERGYCDVLVCNTIFQEGVDIPSLRSVIIAAGGKSQIAAVQRIGRGMRADAKTHKTDFEVWDIADHGCGCTSNKRVVNDDPLLDDITAKTSHNPCRWMEKHTRTRQKSYEDEGFVVIKETDQLLLAFDK